MINSKDRNPQNKQSTTGLILEIQRMSTEDGPGLRTTVFFKGCSLKCTWCHNPESIRLHPEIQWVGSRCIGCRTYIESCPNDSLSLQQGGIPVIIPAIQYQAADSRRLVFSTLPFRNELRTIPADTTVSIFGLNLKMQSVLIERKRECLDITIASWRST
jgi:ferredoxin